MMSRGPGWISDFLIAFFVVAIAILLLIPLPTVALDLLLVVNIAFSILLLVAGLYMPNALALLSFPSILLLTTLFRLGLNVASTRLILSQADAGRVIEAFGSFLTSGETIVGVIIFLIITIVNFVVIARGAGRISEVAARFALDALPGKQMAIDSELKAGLLTPNEASSRRDELRKESQLYGSMDGAMKFVQGDAIAGFFIIITNIVGGLYLGVSKGMPIGQAISTYTTLTVGDGLVSQIPALLVAICAGIIVTRVANEERSTLGQDMGVELLRKPSALFFSGGLVLVLAFFPGIPPLPFITIGSLFIAGGVLLLRYRGGAQIAQPNLALPALGSSSSIETSASAASRERLSFEDSVVIAFDSKALFPDVRSSSDSLTLFWERLRSEGKDFFGVDFPGVRFEANEQLSPGAIEFRYQAARVERFNVPLDAFFVELSERQASPMGLRVIEAAEHPLDAASSAWLRSTRAAKDVIDAASLRRFSAGQFAMLRVYSFFRRNPEEIVTTAAIFRHIQELERLAPGFVSAALNTSFMSPTRLSEIVAQLIRQGIPIGSFRWVIESAAAYCSSYDPTLIKADEFDLDDAVSFFRSSRSRVLLSSLKSSSSALRYVELSTSAEELLESFTQEELRAEGRSVSKALVELKDALFSLSTQWRSLGVPPLVLLAPSELRSRLAILNEMWGLQLALASHSEIPSRTPAVRILRVG